MSSTLYINNGDIVISSAYGRPITISDTAKLRQDIKEFFEVGITLYGFGAGLFSMIGLVQADPDAFVSGAYGTIAQGLQIFRALQRADVATPRSPSELISSYENLKVVQDPSDPTKFIFTVDIYSVNGSSFPFSGIIGG